MCSERKSYNAKKYFIYGFKDYISNRNKIMSKRYFPSIREIMVDYINMYDERIQDGNNKKLENAEKDMEEVVSFYLKKSVFYHADIYKKEIDLILKNIKGDGREKKSSYIMCKTFLKKMELENFYDKIIGLIMETTNYNTIDKIIYSLISELQYDGYSLSKIDSWYNKKLQTRDISLNNIDEKIRQFSQFKQNKMSVTLYVTIKHLGKESVFLGNNIRLSKIDLENVNLPEEMKNYLQISSQAEVFQCEIQAMDKDKALEILLNAFDSYIQMNNFVYSNGHDYGRKIEVGEKIISYCIGEGYQKNRKVIKDEEKIFRYSEEKEKRDIERFIQYRDRVYEENIASDEVSNIQRALNIVKGQMQINKESRIINLWSVLEYILTFHEGRNIISKVKDVIPKVISLYVIKDEINMFWSNLKRYIEDENVKVIIDKCVDSDDETKYDLKKLIEYIMSEGEKLSDKLNFNDVLKKEVCTIGSILTNEDYRKNYVQCYYEEVEYDLTKIYRARNILVHSGKNMIQDINGKILRLYRYNNSLLGVIIYYKSKNPLLTIQEILNSICYTYENYMKSILKNNGGEEKLYNVCRPVYMFLE